MRNIPIENEIGGYTRGNTYVHIVQVGNSISYLSVQMFSPAVPTSSSEFPPTSISVHQDRFPTRVFVHTSISAPTLQNHLSFLLPLFMFRVRMRFDAACNQPLNTHRYVVRLQQVYLSESWLGWAGSV
jgi:hypothetical protein